MTLIEQLDNIQMHFVVGMPRAGTNLLRMILNRNPIVNCTSEVKFSMVFYKEYAHQNPVSPQIIIKFKKFYAKWINIDHTLPAKTTYGKFDAANFLQVAEQNIDKLSYEQLCKLMLLHVKGDEKKINDIKVIVNKNPVFLFSIPELLTIFPDAKFVVTIRDYRAFYLSFKQSKDQSAFTRFLSNSCTSISQYWLIQAETIKQYQKKYPKQLFLLPYERLTTDKENSIKEICSFLDIPFDSAMLSHEEIAVDPIYDTADERAKKKQGDLTKSINTNRIAAWKKGLSPNEITLSEIICGQLGSEFGYAPTQKLSVSKTFFLRFTQLPIQIISQISYTIFTQNYYRLPFKIRFGLQKYFKFTQ